MYQKVIIHENRINELTLKEAHWQGNFFSFWKNWSE